MNGWIRQKYVYVPAGRLGGVCQLPTLAAAVNPAGPKPSSAESKIDDPFASGYAIPVDALQGDLQSVMVWKMLRLASSLMNVSDCPCGRTGGRRPRRAGTGRPADRRSP